VWQDQENDLAFLELQNEEVDQVGVAVCDPLYGWPPPHPKPGDYVLISGFPGVLRSQPHARAIDFAALSTLLQVTTARDRYLVCQFEREHWVSYDINGVPPPGTDWGGMSGGPVLLVRNLAYPLVGLVSEFSRDYELLYLRTLSHLPQSF
jgi:hypothetical protein